MTLLLCPECCQWREPIEGRCLVCAATLDLAIPDLTIESIAEQIGDLQGLLGEAELSRSLLPKLGQLFSTTSGLLFVPSTSRVIVFDNVEHKQGTQRSRFGRFWKRLWQRRFGRYSSARFDCEPRVRMLDGSDRHELAVLLRSDPGVCFWDRRQLAHWRRVRGEWECLRPDSRPWPERVAMRDRDGDRALQTWLETSLCPLPTNAHSTDSCE